MANLRSFLETAHALRRKLEQDAIFNGAAALVFYFILALFPAIIFLLSLLPLIPLNNIENVLMDLTQQTLPPEASVLVLDFVRHMSSQPRNDWLSFGLLGSVWAASTGIVAIMGQLNSAYEIAETRSFWRIRLLSLFLLIVFSLAVLGAFVLIVLGSGLQGFLITHYALDGPWNYLFTMLRWLFVLLMMTAAFGTIYYLAPDLKQQIRNVIPGSVFGALAMAVISLSFKYYVANFGSYDKTYGSLGGVVVLMLWLYACALVLLIGAMLNSQLSRKPALAG